MHWDILVNLKWNIALFQHNMRVLEIKVPIRIYYTFALSIIIQAIGSHYNMHFYPYITKLGLYEVEKKKKLHCNGFDILIFYLICNQLMSSSA